MNRKVKNGEMEEIPAGCGDCSSCGNTCCSSKSFFDMSVDNKKEETKAASEEKAEALAAVLEEKYPDCEVEVNNGGQPIYYYIISVE